MINAIAFYCCAVPLALVLAFRFNLGPEGLYLGMVVGPLIQATCYADILYRTDWSREAK